MTTKPTSTLFRLLISIAITVGVVLVYAKPVLDEYQLDGFLLPQQQQQQPEQPNAGEDFFVAYGGDIPHYNLDGTDIKAAPQSAVPTSPTPTIQENPTLTEGGGPAGALQWVQDTFDRVSGKYVTESKGG